jgi:hypothetical protein
MSTKVTIYRDSGTGRIISQQTASTRDPRTVEKEKVTRK